MASWKLTFLKRSQSATLQRPLIQTNFRWNCTASDKTAVFFL